MIHTTAVVFPFDSFGNAGTGTGAQLLGDVLHEALTDTADEPRRTRPHSYAESLDVEEVPFETMEQLAAWRTTGRALVRQLLDDGDFVLWLAGNHLGVLPVYEELGADTLVIQFDAHLDCYDLHDTTPTLSHGNFLLHAETQLPRIVNIGHRDLFLLPAEIKQTFTEAFSAEQVATDFPSVLEVVKKHAKKAKRVWIDLDVDALDPAYAPAVHQPMPFGLTPMQLLAVIAAVWSPKVIGVSINEYDPGRDVRDTTLNLLGWLLERMMQVNPASGLFGSPKPSPSVSA